MDEQVPAPKAEAQEPEHALTFFVTRSERRTIVAALRVLDPDRVRALRAALGIRDTGTATA